MIEISNKTVEAFKSDSKRKVLKVYFPEINLTLSNADIVSESLKIKESIQSGEDLDYIGCCASSCEIEVVNTAYDFVGKKVILSVDIEDGEDTIPLFYGYVASSKKQNTYVVTRKLICYDPLADILQKDCTDWYNGLTFPMRVLDFRNAFWAYMGYPQEEIQLINDFIWISKGLDGKSKISGKTIIEAICEFNACFGIFNRLGVWTYQYLNDIYAGLYPADDLYPDDLLFPSSESPDSEHYDSAHVIDVYYEDYTTKCVDKVVVLDKEGYVTGEEGSGENVFAVANNFLAFGITRSESQEAAQKIYYKISMIDYVPCELKTACTPWVECSDILVFQTKKDILRSYVLTRTMSGIQAMYDSFDSNGNEYRNTELDSVETKLNTLSADISTETTRASNSERQLRSDLGTEINNRVEAVNGCYSQITQTATQIRTEVGDVQNGLKSQITQTASEIRAEVSNVQSGLQSQISQTASEIRAEVSSVDGHVSSLELSVNDQGNAIASLSADVVNVRGDVINLDARVTNVANLVASKASVSDLNAVRASVNNLTFDTLLSHDRSWVEAYVELKGQHSTYWATILIQG